MSQTKQNTCSFCGGKGHNLRGCEFSHFAMCFFTCSCTGSCTCAPAHLLQPEKLKVERKCSSCGQNGHYRKTCPLSMSTVVVVEKTYKRPRGRSPIGKVWDSEFGFWDDIVVTTHLKTHRARVPMNTHSITNLYTPTEVSDITLFM